MKKQLLSVFIALFAMTFAACSSSDNEVQNEQGNQLKLSAGITAQKEPYNIGEWGSTIDVGDIDAQAKENVFSDYADSILTRTPVDNNNWEGMSNRNIAVQVGGSVYQYSVNASGSLTSNTPYYFTSTNNISISVSSWYPYSASLSTFAVQTDQSSYANYEKSDLLYATTQMNQSSPSGTLTYAHKTAKVIVYVMVNNVQYLASDAITAVSMSNIKTSATVSNGNLTASGSNGTIKMYNNVASRTTSNNSTATFEACVIPQTAAIGLTINYCGTTYTTTLSSKSLTAGNQYTANVTITVQGSGTINGHNWVRLGSPTKWATMNIGASSVSGASSFGNYYQWGSSTPTPEGSKEHNYYTETGVNITPSSGYDTARNIWGSTWRMPTLAELEFLYANCTWTYTRQSDNTYVYVLISKRNSNSINLPCAGEIIGGSRKYYSGEGSRCCYWSSTRHPSITYYACALGWNCSEQIQWLDGDDNGSSSRDEAFPCRPVSD